MPLEGYEGKDAGDIRSNIGASKVRRYGKVHAYNCRRTIRDVIGGNLIESLRNYQEVIS